MPENSNCSGASSCSKESCEGCPSNAKNKAGGGIAKEPMNAASNVKKVIGVVSGKGGVGKSFVTASLAAAMNRAGYKVGIMDADITGPSIPKMFGIHGQVYGTDDGMVPMETENGIKIMSINLLLDDEEAPVIWRGPVIAGVVITLIGIAIIGIAGSMKSATLSEEEKKAAVKDFNFPKGITIALLAGFMSGCFNVGLEFGKSVSFPDSAEIFKTLPATFLVTLGGFVTNAIYCFYQNQKNHTWGDYKKTDVWANNALFCLLAGALRFSHFFGLSIGKGFLTSSEALMTLSFCILMALNVVFSNVWGIILKEWKGCNRKTITVLVIGLVVLIFAAFAEPLIRMVFGD